MESGPEAVAICLLFSYKNPVHEILLEKAFKKHGIPVSRSSEIIPEFREFERASTTAINAFIQPVVQSYVQEIRRAARKVGRLRDYDIMKSAGGVAASGEIDGLPVRIPTLDITTIGAGGGSIAWMDKGGALRIGPQSAGSEPGPACYGTCLPAKKPLALFFCQRTSGDRR